MNFVDYIVEILKKFWIGILSFRNQCLQNIWIFKMQDDFYFIIKLIENSATLYHKNDIYPYYWAFIGFYFYLEYVYVSWVYIEKNSSIPFASS